MKKMASYDEYVLATILPPIIIISTILLSSYFTWGVSYLMFTIQKRRAERTATDVVIEYPGLQYMYIALQPVFGNKLQARKTRDRVKLKLHGEEISPGAIPLVTQLVALALGLTLAVFVTVLTVEIGQVCDEKLDCFPFNYSRQARPLITESIQNCSTYRNNDITIVCFHFTIRLIDALGSSGGVLALTTIGINFYVALLFALAQARCCRVTGLFGCLLLFLTGCTILLSTLLWVLPLGLLQSKMLKSVRNWESVLVYYYTIMYLLLIATVLPCCVSRHHQDFRRCWNRERRRYQGPNHGSETADEDSHEPEANPPSQARSRGYYVSFERSSSQTRQRGYYGSVDERQSSTEPTNEVSAVISKQMVQSSDQEPQSSASQTSSTVTAGGVRGAREGQRSPLVYQTKSVRSQYSTRHRSKKTSNPQKTVRKDRTAGEQGGGRGKEKGGHWADAREIEDAESEGEWGTTNRYVENNHGHQNNVNESETSSGEEGGDGSQGGEGRGGTGRGQESARIRAVLTEGGVENRDTSIHTHL